MEDIVFIITINDYHESSFQIDFEYSDESKAIETFMKLDDHDYKLVKCRKENVLSFCDISPEKLIELIQDKLDQRKIDYKLKNKEEIQKLAEKFLPLLLEREPSLARSVYTPLKLFDLRTRNFVDA